MRQTTNNRCSTRWRPTTKTLNFLTHQDIFDQAVAHLFDQETCRVAPARRRGLSRLLRYCGGCPVGSFIKPRDYTTAAMEGIRVRLSAKRQSKWATVDLLSCLQNVHDVFGTWEWRERLGSIARPFGLSADQLKNAA
ncbi:hypothetical protein [Burkholderia sp. SG-MS1]|uniref:hypothetical protein n=1 Tax=Paraburkholderia sp. SG-MS1 TaxID=2023741 RepID=UPI001446352D